MMRRFLLFPLMLLAVFSAVAQKDNSNKEKNMETKTIKLKVDDTVFTATLADNSSAKALLELLAEGDITIQMEDYANMEKVGSLGKSLPRNDRPTITAPGDLILYQGHNLVIYYDKNSWNFTRLGKIEGVSGKDLLAILGQGDVTVTLSVK